jgi:hypothetical protein
MEAAITARRAGDYAAAIGYLLDAGMILAAKPAEIHSNAEFIRYETRINEMLTELRKSQHASTGLQQITLEHIRPEDE